MPLPRHLLILTGEHEAGPLESAVQGAAPPGVSVSAVTTRNELVGRHRRSLDGTRLVSMCTRVIVPPDFLAALTLEPYNVHPGSPQYPGAFPDAFAVYEGAKRFAATTHVMTADVDAGAIVRTDWFEVPSDWRRDQLAERVYEAALGLFFEAVLVCMSSDEPLPRTGESWSGRRRTRAQYRALCKPTGDASEDDRRIRAFAPDFPASHLRRGRRH